MDALLAEDVAAAQRRLLLRLLTHVPLLRNPSRPYPNPNPNPNPDPNPPP